MFDPETLDFLEELRSTREKGWQMEDELPPGTIEQMDRAVDLLKNQLSMHHTRLDCLDEPAPKPKKGT